MQTLKRACHGGTLASDRRVTQSFSGSKSCVLLGCGVAVIVSWAWWRCGWGPGPPCSAREHSCAAKERHQALSPGGWWFITVGLLVVGCGGRGVVRVCPAWQQAAVQRESMNTRQLSHGCSAYIAAVIGSCVCGGCGIGVCSTSCKALMLMQRRACHGGTLVFGQRATQSSEQLLCGVVVIVGLGLVVMWMLFVQPTALRKGQATGCQCVLPVSVIPILASYVGHPAFRKVLA